jgi:hypothetical protein
VTRRETISDLYSSRAKDCTEDLHCLKAEETSYCFFRINRLRATCFSEISSGSSISLWYLRTNLSTLAYLTCCPRVCRPSPIILSFSCSNLTRALCYACRDSFSSLSYSFMLACSVYSRDSFLRLCFSYLRTCYMGLMKQLRAEGEPPDLSDTASKGSCAM